MVFYTVITSDSVMRLAVFMLFMLLACTTMPQVLKTSDSQAIAYDASLPPKATTGVILLHMLGRDHRDWDDFRMQLSKKGYASIAVDLRGHGQSSGNWQKFSEKDFQAMQLDVDAAGSYLKSKGIKKIVLVGASIGANTALRYAAGNPDVIGVALLSPGENYRGVKTLDVADKLTSPLFVAVATGDRQSIGASKQIHDAALGQKLIKIYDGSEHGTNLFVRTDLQSVLLSWIDGL